MARLVPLITREGENTMFGINKLYVIVGIAIAYCLVFGIIANADELDQATKVTFSAPVQLPGEVLPAGTYTFKLLDDGSDPNVVMIFNSDETKLYGSFETVSAERSTATADTALTFAEPETGQPDALVNWFYPGRLTGNEFLYAGDEQKEVAQGMQHTILAGEAGE
jgi:hypothetical protein